MDAGRAGSGSYAGDQRLGQSGGRLQSDQCAVLRLRSGERDGSASPRQCAGRPDRDAVGRLFPPTGGKERVKLSPQRVTAFLRDPGACRVVLLYGEDHGMSRDRAAALVRTVAGSLDDPFLVAELGREDIARLADEAASLALTGGRRVVRLRETTDAATEQVAAILKGPAPALVVLEASGLPTRSRLRLLVEAAPDGAAIACYPEEGRALADTIRAVLSEVGAGIDSD